MFTKTSVSLAALITLAGLAPHAQAQNLRPDMRTWTVTPKHSSVTVTKTADLISWTKCNCGNEPVRAEVVWTVPESGLYLMSIQMLNLDVSGTDLWGYGAQNLGTGPSIQARWDEWDFNAPQHDFPQTLGQLRKGDRMRLYVDGKSSTFGGRQLGVTLTKAEAPILTGKNWNVWTGPTDLVVDIQPRSQRATAWVFFVSPQRLARAIPLPGVIGTGLWLKTPIFIASTTQTQSVTLRLTPTRLQTWPKLFWQLIELENSPSGLQLSIGSRNYLTDRR